MCIKIKLNIFYNGVPYRIREAMKLEQRTNDDAMMVMPPYIAHPCYQQYRIFLGEDNESREFRYYSLDQNWQIQSRGVLRGGGGGLVTTLQRGRHRHGVPHQIP